MSRVRAGDLAIIRCAAPANLNNRIVEVISVAPNERFRLPNGYYSDSNRSSEIGWIVKFVGGPGLCPYTDGRERPTSYAVAPDWCLYPLPGDPESVDERETDEVSA